ncbi:MAG TPA: hypothetical protein VGN72_13440 [Tepidisphaeraceae bacterium]|jgi:hypothetical protein|nr:hypothetical protein [Tepidisphaeraceae bacterium]
MTLLELPPITDAVRPVSSPTAADAQAAANMRANRAAMAATRPDLLNHLIAPPADARWTFGRDGALTAMLDSHWWGGNSLPARSAAMMLKDVDRSAAVSCAVAPTHAVQIRELLGRIDPQQAVIVVQPDLAAACIALHCEDFSDAMTTKRLWWAIGPNWADQLQRLLSDHPGLPIPSRYIRTPDVEEGAAGAVITTAGQIFNDAIAARAIQITAMRNAGVRQRHCVLQIAVAAPSRFRLWGNAGSVLAGALLKTTPQHVGVDWMVIDTDIPTTASPLAIASAAAACDAIVMADVARADHPNLLATELPWITWMTTPRVPSFTAVGPHDRLLVTEPAWERLATNAGWPTDRVAVAGWPTVERNSRPAPEPRIALLADVSDLAVPAFTEEFSSHRLLWEMIRNELTRSPFRLGTDVNGYLDRQLRQATIDPATIDRAAFVEKLILPAYAIGVAGALSTANLPVSLHGKGWETTAYRDQAVGEVRSQAAFDQAVDGAVLVRPWPMDFVHEIDAQNRPVITAASTLPRFLIDARSAMQGTASARDDGPILSADVVLSAIARG